jgi:AraC family transcriptional regulator of adaptative response/methylated-DNA-[protein]-cysteine methyltransferase
MRINDFSQLAEDYLTVKNAIESVPDNAKPLTVRDHIIENLQWSDDRLENLFKRWAGVGPNRFFQFLTQDHAHSKMAESRGQRLFDTSSQSVQLDTRCMNGPSVHLETMTPGEFKRLGPDMKMIYGFHPTPFGECFLVQTERGIPYLGFVEPHDSRDLALDRFRRFWPGAMLSENQTETGILVNRIFEPDHSRDSTPLKILMKGTDFQISVWQALLRIPPGSVVSYEAIAAGIGRPKAVRAVGNAIAANPVAYLVPCHRVIAKSGRIHRYGWGPSRKKAMIGWESAKFSTF